MARIRRAQHQRGYITVSNDLAQSKTLTLRAKGLLVYLLSLPDNFVLRVNVLIQRSIEGKHVIYQTLDELKRAGLLDRVQYREPDGKISGWDYIIYDTIQLDLLKKYNPEALVSENQEVDENSINSNPHSNFLDEENQDLDNQPLNNIYSKNKYIKKAAAIDRSEKGKEPESAAVDFSSTAEKTISTQLTQSQKQRVWQVAKEYCKQYAAQLGSKNAEALYREMHYDLENPKAWTLCGNDFEKKLNAIRKYMREGKWVTPVGLIQRAQPSHAHTAEIHPFTGNIKTLQDNYRKQQLELNSCLQAHGSPMAQFPEFIQQEEAKAQELRESLIAIQAQLERYGVWDIIKSTLPLPAIEASKRSVVLPLINQQESK